MPTENRSSNTEQMVSVPREHDLKICRTPLDDLLSGAKTGEIRDCSNREFAAGDTVLLREVDDARAYTGRTTRRTITHVQKYYGLPDHLCVLSYAQHQGEPVALPARKAMTTHGLTALDSEAEGWNAYHDEIAKLGPLYTHPAPPVPHGKPAACATIEVAPTAGQPKARVLCFDSEQLPMGSKVKVYTHADAGEVERLRAELDSMNETFGMQEAKIDTLRDQLAEAHALLTELEDCPWVVDEVTIPKAGIEAAPHQVVGTMHVGLMRLRKVRAWLSASAEPIPFPGYPPAPEDRKLPAEPSAPVERDERADFEADQLSKGFAIDLLPGTVATYMIPAVRFAWAGWQARAALERKP